MGLPFTQFTAGDKVLAANMNSDFLALQNSVSELIANEAINTTAGPKPFYITSNGWIQICDGNVLTKLEFVGFVLTGQNVSTGAFVKVQFNGLVGGFSGLTRGNKYYLQDDQTIGLAVGTYYVIVGIAISSTELLIYRGQKYNTGTMTRVMNAGNGSVNTAHNLGVIPRQVKITAFMADGVYYAPAESVGVYINGLTNTIYNKLDAASKSIAEIDTTNIVTIIYDNSRSEVATITVDITNIILTWTESGTPAAKTIQILWEAWAD